MGLRRNRLCRMRLSPGFIVIIGIATILTLGSYLRSRGSEHETESHSMRDRFSASRLLTTNQGKNRKRIRFDDEDEQPFQICQTPRLSLQNDANAKAFYDLPQLNCSKANSLFYTRMGGLYLNKTVLGGRTLERCEYKAVVWETDFYHSYSEPLVRKAPPFEIKVKHDFFKIECYLKKDNSSKELVDQGETAIGMKRRLLQVREGVSLTNTNDRQLNSEQRLNHVYQNRQITFQNTQSLHRNLETIQNVPVNNRVRNPAENSLISHVKHKLDYSQRLQNTQENNIRGNQDVARNLVYVPPNTIRQNANWGEAPVKQQYQSPNAQQGVQQQHQFSADAQQAVPLNNFPVKGQQGVQQQQQFPAQQGAQQQYFSVNTHQGVQQQHQSSANLQQGVQQQNQFPVNVQQQRMQGTGLNSPNHGAGMIDPNGNKKSLVPGTANQESEARVESNNSEKKENTANEEQREEKPENSEYEYRMPVDYHYAAPETPDFEQYFVQVTRREDVIKRIKDIKPNKHSTQMNVLMFAMDSMSHMAYQRKMPKTYKYLKEKLGAVMLNSYNIVGDATTAAIIPMLTGKTEVELPEARKNMPGSTYLDAYPLVWNRFEQNGYATLLAEDEPSVGVFNLRLNGFEEIPTDHYMRHFWLASHASNLYDISPRFCLGKTARHQFLLQYLRKFHLAYKDVPTFSFNMMTEYTHGNNNPAQYVDEDLVETLEILLRNQVLDNTLVVVFGDHGARTSASRKTIQGKMEERLPMMSFAFPQWFKEKHPKLVRNLETNANRLTTPFDIYETLRDVLDITRPQAPITFKERGISLLKEIPLNRTCTAAGIDMHWCTCMHWRPIDGFEAESKQAAGHIVDFMNGITDKHRYMCHKLVLKRIEDAKMVFPNEKVLTFMKSIDSDQRIANFSRDVDIDLIHYQIIVETSPNNGLYEATVTYDVASKTYKVSPDISRINIYGKQASCVEEKLPDLRKYCHCKDRTGNV